MVAQAANVATVVLQADGTINAECVNIDDGESAYHAFQETSLSMDWSYTVGIGYFLNSVEGVASDDGAGKYWSFWHINSAETDFESAMVGASDYEIETDDKVIGLSYTSFDNSWNPITKPPFSDYEDICEPVIDVKKVTVEINGDKDTLREDDSFEVKPGDKLLFTVKVENQHDDEDLEDVEVDVIIRDIDDGDDIEEESDAEDIKDGKEETFEIEMEIPIDVDEGNYEVEVTITGDIDFPYRKILLYELEVDKDNHEISVDIPEEADLQCGYNYRLNIKLDNIGKDDEDVSLSVMNGELEVSIEDSFEIEESEGTSKSYSFRTPSDAFGPYSLLTTVTYSDELDQYYTTLNIDCDEELEGDIQGLLNMAGGDLLIPNDPPGQNNQEPQNNYPEPESLSPTYMILLILGNIVLILVIIIIIARWRRN